MAQTATPLTPYLTGQVSNTGLSTLLRRLIIFEIAFYFAYQYGMGFLADYPSPLWFPDSILLCALLVSPKRTWWMYILAAVPIRFLVAVPAGTPVWFLFAAFLNDSSKGLLAAWLLRRGSEDATRFDNLREFGRYLVVAVVLAPALSAFGGAASRILLGSKFWPGWPQWFLGDALANLALTPALCCFVRGFPDIFRASLKRYVEALLIASGMTIAAYLAFDSGHYSQGYPPLLVYIPVPFLLWAAVRFGPLGTTGALSFISIVAMFGAVAGRGPFAPPSTESTVLSVQLFLLLPSIPFLLLAVLTQQQRNIRRRSARANGDSDR